MVIILYRMGAFHLLGQIVHGLSKRKPKFRTSKFLSRNGLFHLHKSVPFTEKRPRKPETGIKDRFEQIEDEFLFGILANIPCGTTRLHFQMFRCSRKFNTGTTRKLVFHVHFGKWKAPNVSQILLKKRGKLLVKRKSVADRQNGGNFQLSHLVFSLEVRAFSQQDASKVDCRVSRLNQTAYLWFLKIYFHIYQSINICTKEGIYSGVIL